MKTIISIIALLAATSAAAQTTTGTGTGTANSSTGPSTSGVVFNPVSNSNYEAPDTKPNSVFAPSFNSTANCVKGSSAGIAVAGVQLAGGGTSESDWCQTIREMEVAYVIGGPDYGRALALEVGCNLPRLRKARLLTGKPCKEDADQIAANQVKYQPVANTDASRQVDPLVEARKYNTSQLQGGKIGSWSSPRLN